MKTLIKVTINGNLYEVNSISDMYCSDIKSIIEKIVESENKLIKK